MLNNIIQEKLPAYLRAGVKGKTTIISAVCEIGGFHRKAFIRAFGRAQRRSNWKPKVKRGRPKKYTTETEAALAWVWEQYEYPCAERLKDEIPEAIRIFMRDGMWGYSEQATQQLWDMSLGAMKVRCVHLAKEKGLMRGISTTKSAALLTRVPIFFGSWDSKGAGFGQVDTVVHSGPKLIGTMAYSVDFTDVATYWQEPVCQLSKGERATLVSMRIIQHRLPFPLLGMHPDSGSEFVNDVAADWAEAEGIELTRSRPNKSNDNPHIEQRNLVVVRGLFRIMCKLLIVNLVYYGHICKQAGASPLAANWD